MNLDPVRSLPVLSTLMAILVLLPLQAQALSSDRQKPVNISADKVTVNQRTGISVYTGKVIVTQGTLRITADKLTVYTVKRRLDRMVAVGKPATYRQRPDNKPGYIQGRARTMEYFARRDVVVLKQQAVLVQSKNTFKGSHIVYNLKTDHVESRGAGSKSRVRITIEPQEKTGGNK